MLPAVGSLCFLSFGKRRLRALGFATNQFRIELLAEPDKEFVLEVSSDLVQWLQLQSVLPAQTSTMLADTSTPLPGFRFYRIRAALLSLLRPTSVDLFSGDQEMFFVEDGSIATNWVWSVSGIVGGNADVGTILQAPAVPWLAAFKAPATVGMRQVEICAESLDAPGKRHCATVRIIPRPTTFDVRPLNPTLGLGQQIDFTTGAMVEGVGYVSFRRVWWKINSVLAGDPQLGIVEFDGTYRAPLSLPANRNIRVGFSLSVPGPITGDTSVRLARLVVQPNEIDSIAIGKAATLIPSLLFSDGTRFVLPTNENRLNASRYVGRTPLKVRESSGAAFHALMPNESPSAQRFFETTEFLLDVPSTQREPFSAENRSPWLRPGQTEFQQYAGLESRRVPALVAEVRGTTGWTTSLASGLPIVDFGPGLRLLNQSIRGETLVVRLAADANHFANTPDAFGAREVAVTVPDGSRWQTRLTMARYSVKPALACSKGSIRICSRISSVALPTVKWFWPGPGPRWWTPSDSRLTTSPRDRVPCPERGQEKSNQGRRTRQWHASRDHRPGRRYP